MARPQSRRVVGQEPAAVYYKPAGIPMHSLEEVVLTLDEMESLRLADLEGLYQEEAAERMGISRTTLSRMLAQAHCKVADALVNGKALRVEGGEVVVNPGMPGPGWGCRRRFRGGQGQGRGGGQGRGQGRGGGRGCGRRGRMRG